jgi:hypothetical protein
MHKIAFGDHQEHAQDGDRDTRQGEIRRPGAFQRPVHECGNRRLQRHDDGGMLGPRFAQADEYQDGKR